MNIAAILGAVVIVMGLASYFLFNKYTHEVELRVEAQVAAESQRLAKEYIEETAKLSQRHSDILAERNLQFVNLKSEHQNEINSLRSIIDSRAIEEPFNTGNDFERRLAFIMCRIQAGSSSDAREACNLRATATYSPDRAIVVTVTADTTEGWRILCEEGQRDFCDYAIIGFTSQGALTILDWLEDVDAYQAQLNSYIDSQQAIQDELLK